MRTRIELGSSGDIELFEDISTPLTFSIADIRTPETRQGSFSKTITIPGTKQNNKLLGHIFDINVGDCTFNPKLKTPARLYINDVPQLTGFLQLLKIKKLDNYKIEYEVALFGKNSNIFIDIGDDLLTDLDYSELNHQYTRDEQSTSWGTTYTNGYVYPLIDYGFDSDINSYDVEHLFPATYLRTYIDKIFAGVGYTYQSTFFDSAFFKKLIIPATGTKIGLSSAQIDARIFNAYDSTPRTYTGIPLANIGTTAISSALEQLIIPNETNDPSNQFNTGTYIATIANSGYYNLYSTFEFYLSALSSTTFPAVPTRMNILIERKPSGSSFWNVINSNYQDVAFYPASSGDISSTYSLYCALGNTFLDAGDQLRLRFYVVQNSNGTPAYAFEVKSTGVVFENSVVNSGLVSGNDLDYNQAIPQNIKQKDLLSSVIKAFNLYIDVDNNNDKKLLIETRDDFYSSGTIQDWSHKLDISQNIEYTPLGDLDFRKFRYSYKKDTDKYNKQYEDNWKEVYGELVYDNGNEFLTSENKTELIFSPTPLCDDVSSNRVVSRIWDVQSNGTIKPKAFNIRLLYYGGLKSTNVDWIHTERGGADVVNSTYPFAGHVDSPTSPTLDLNFGVPREIYYRASTYTANNLFNTYYSKFINEITDKDSKIVTAYFHLTPLDILTLDFRNEFYFDNQRFRLNKIYDYNPIVNELTKCEFIKLKQASRYVAQTAHNINGYGVSSGDIQFNPSFGFDVVRADGSNSSSTPIGNDNTYGNGGRNVLVNGNHNYIHDYSTNITLLGSSGDIISSGLENVTLINTNNVEISSGDIVLINNVPLPSITPLYAPIKTITQSSYNILVTDSTLLVDASANNVTINLVFNAAFEQYATAWVHYDLNGTQVTFFFTKILNIKKIDSSGNTVTIDPDGSATIDGAATKVLTTQYEHTTIQYDGTNWHTI
jgi:hypothetical protein